MVSDILDLVSFILIAPELAVRLGFPGQARRKGAPKTRQAGISDNASPRGTTKSSSDAQRLLFTLLMVCTVYVALACFAFWLGHMRFWYLLSALFACLIYLIAGLLCIALNSWSPWLMKYAAYAGGLLFLTARLIHLMKELR